MSDIVKDMVICIFEDAVSATEFEAIAKDAEIERLGKELESADRVANDWARQRMAWAHDTIKLITTIKYLIGIAERGEGREINSNETAEGFVLAYVKKLESENARLRVERDEARKTMREWSENCGAEVQRLRGLLREAIDADRDHYATAMAVLMAGCWHKRVREALGE